MRWITQPIGLTIIVESTSVYALVFTFSFAPSCFSFSVGPPVDFVLVRPVEFIGGVLLSYAVFILCV